MINAEDRTTNTTIHPTVWERWPDSRVWLVAADVVAPSRIAAIADDLIQPCGSNH